VSIFALTVADAFAALEAIAGSDAGDAYARALRLGTLGAPPPALRIGVPRTADRLFFGDARSEAGFAKAEEIALALGATLVEIDLTPFLDTARLLYDGPWVAERTAAVGDFIARRPADVHPVTRRIIEEGTAKSAADAFRGFYRLAELRTRARHALDGIDALLVPTMPAPCPLAEIEADPIGPNARLGTYTNFVNLLDLAGIAIPIALDSDGTPFGATLLGQAGRDAELAGLALAMHARTGLTLGALGVPHNAPQPPAPVPRADEIAIAVVGAHLSGLPLNGELVASGARFLRTAATANDYRLFALPDRQQRPGLLRVADGEGAAIALEVWAIEAPAFGRFVATVPPPLSIGTVRLGDGSSVMGFLVEAQGTAGARDISAYGGWRAFLAAETTAPPPGA
jgi:allophanate hydrolase